MRDIFKPIYGQFYGARCLNIGSGFTLEHSENGRAWTNMDYNPKCGAEVIHNLLEFPWPFPDDSFDTIQATHVMEHFWGHDIIKIAKEASRVLKVGGWWVVAVPYGAHCTSWHNLHHKQRWDQTTIGYLCRSQYSLPKNGVAHAGTGADHGSEGLEYAEWRVGAITFTPAEKWRGKPDQEIAEASQKYVDVIQEMQFAIRLEEK